MPDREMTTPWRLLAGATLLMTALAAAPAGTGPADDERRVRPRYTERVAVDRPRDRRGPAELAVPDDLRVEVVVRTDAGDAGADPPLAAQGDGVTRRRAPVTEALDAAAREAGVWTADEKARDGGRRAYYRVGFRLAMDDALGDPTLGAWDHADGVRHGSMDAQAGALGAELAADAARDAVGPAAEEQVARQFRDLAREPEFRPRPAPPPFRPVVQMTVPVELHEVIAYVGPMSLDHVARRFETAFRNYGLDPWAIHATRGHRHVWDAAWADPRRAFEFWLQGRKRSAVYRRIVSGEERERFRRVFERAFARALPDFFDTHLRRGFREGVRDGWDYGRAVINEWQFRLGYNEGFDRAVSDAAARTFPSLYADAYTAAYEAAFDDWSSTVRPEIVDLTVADANDDGVFEPGEELVVDYEVANFGGGSGTVDVELAGAGLAGGGRTVVDLPGRGTLRADEPLRGVLREGLAARQDTRLSLRVADEVRPLSVRVGYPLEFLGQARIVGQDTLAGSATVRVTVANTSRRTVPAAVELAHVDGYAMRERRDLDPLPAGGEADVSFRLEGLHPLDLLSGELGIELVALRRGEALDRLAFRVPDRATDLASRDLLAYMVELARLEDPPYQDVMAARDLMIRRLGADWRVAARGKGNPYKEDAKDGGTATALGELVQTVRREERRMRSPQVFEGLDAEVARLAEELPGAHPFLRKWMKRLARQMG